MLKAMRPINKKKGNKQVSVVAGGFFPGALCGAVGVVAGVGALAGRPPPGRWSGWVSGNQIVRPACPPASPSPVGACGGSPLLPAPPPPGTLVPWVGGGRLRAVGC